MSRKYAGPAESLPAMKPQTDAPLTSRAILLVGRRWHLPITPHTVKQDRTPRPFNRNLLDTTGKSQILGLSSICLKRPPGVAGHLILTRPRQHRLFLGMMAHQHLKSGHRFPNPDLSN
ncbi:Hypothetical predicted protein [Podarcis lilfordi]|uniref:Uncharacterized protein n=1 Tax=Podarcis lilfordi TaxID=74358 RepID=A0AA35NZB7_9SAUR|nr:Hypothetical predicted protein [Podarcis lilfordi]